MEAHWIEAIDADRVADAIARLRALVDEYRNEGNDG
jgi:hypothetical protein